MEFHFVALFLFLAVLFTLAKSFKKPKQNLPPGPWKLPLIGSMHHLVGSLIPHRTLRDLARKYGPLMHLQLGELSVVVVSSPRLAEQILTTYDLNFANRPETLAGRVVFYDGKDIANSQYGHYWRQMRKISVLELLSAKRVRSFSSMMLDQVSRLVASIETLAATGEPINLSERMASHASTVLFRAAFGGICKDQNKFFSLIEEAAIISAGFIVHDLFPSLKFLHILSQAKPKLAKIHKQIDSVLQENIDLHKEKLKTKVGDGEPVQVVDALLRLQASGEHLVELDDENIKAIILDLFGAAADTSTITMEWAMSEMMRNPKVMAKAQSEVRQAFKGQKTINENGMQGLKYLKSVIKETLRRHPPAPLLVPRECRKECEIEGYVIPVKTQLWINAWALGNDPDYWDDPESFRPERFEDSSTDFLGNDFQYLPFGGGRRICPGISFALPSLEVAMAALLFHFDWKLPAGVTPSDLDMTEIAGTTTRKKNSIYLVASPYNPSL